MSFKKTSLLFSTLLIISSLGSCAISTDPEGEIKIEGNSVTVTDSLNQEIVFESIPTNVVFLQSSLAVPWLLCDGKIKGICSDYKDYKLDTDFGITELNTNIIGISAHSPDKGKILACNPDVVFYSPDIAAQKDVALGVQEAGYKVFAVKIENFDNYYNTLKKFSAILTRKMTSDFVTTYGDNVKNEINSYIEKAKGKSSNAIAFRARSSGYTIFKDLTDHFILEIFRDLNIENKTNISWDNKAFDMSKLLIENPQYIFYFHMGSNNDDAIEKFLDENVRNNPNWNSLYAVSHNNVKLLSQDLFHYKPNHKWAEAYKEVYNIVYGE